MIFFKDALTLSVLFSCVWGASAFCQERISVMQYNVENLFDTRDDPNRDDETFLPLKKKRNPKHKKRCQRIAVKAWKEQCLKWDWSDKNLRLKMERLTGVLKMIHQGHGPDILILEEVENLNVLDLWRTKHLQSMGYTSRVLIEGPDKRGIDIAVLSRLPVQGKPVLHVIPFQNLHAQERKDTRGILEVTLTLPDGQPLSVFGLHLPAPFHPSKLRQKGIEYLNHLRLLLPPQQLVIAAGDFNITAAEDLKEKTTEMFLAPGWISTHLHCQACKGTSYYAKDRSWSFLDRIMLSK